jgi:hypothetical protein
MHPSQLCTQPLHAVTVKQLERTQRLQQTQLPKTSAWAFAVRALAAIVSYKHRLVHLDESAKQLSELQCNLVNPKFQPRARHLGQSRRVRACWDIGPPDSFAIYTEAACAHSGTTEVLYGEAEGRSSQSIGIETRRRQAWMT